MTAFLMFYEIIFFLNLNQWIITDISAKYVTDNQWIKNEIPNLANRYYVI